MIFCGIVKCCPTQIVCNIRIKMQDMRKNTSNCHVSIVLTQMHYITISIAQGSCQVEHEFDVSYRCLDCIVVVSDFLVINLWMNFVLCYFQLDRLFGSLAIDNIDSILFIKKSCSSASSVDIFYSSNWEMPCLNVFQIL